MFQILVGRCLRSPRNLALFHCILCKKVLHIQHFVRDACSDVRAFLYASAFLCTVGSSCPSGGFCRCSDNGTWAPGPSGGAGVQLPCGPRSLKAWWPWIVKTGQRSGLGPRPGEPTNKPEIKTWCEPCNAKSMFLLFFLFPFPLSVRSLIIYPIEGCLTYLIELFSK